MNNKERLDYIKDKIERILDTLEGIMSDVDDIIETPVSKLEDAIYSKYGIYTRLEEQIDELGLVQEELDELYETEQD